jgi:transposase
VTNRGHGFVRKPYVFGSQAVSIAEMADRCAVDRDTVSTWIDRWEQLGPAGLTDQSLRGNPGRLTAAEKPLVFDRVKEHPRSIVSIRAA